MQKPWWENPARFLCVYWWLVLSLMALILALMLTRGIWVPIFFETPEEPQLADEFGRELGTGELRFTLEWVTTDDLDLYVADPNNEILYFKNRRSSTGGQFDGGSNEMCGRYITENAVENAFWPQGTAPSGEYRIFVHYHTRCTLEGGGEVPFCLKMWLDGKFRKECGQIAVPGEIKEVYQLLKD